MYAMMHFSNFLKMQMHRQLFTIIFTYICANFSNECAYQNAPNALKVKSGDVVILLTKIRPPHCTVRDNKQLSVAHIAAGRSCGKMSTAVFLRTIFLLFFNIVFAQFQQSLPPFRSFTFNVSPGMNFINDGVTMFNQFAFSEVSEVMILNVSQ